MGEKSVNSTTTAPRADFIQSVLDDAYAAHPWRFARATATLTLSSQLTTLPTNYDSRHAAYATFSDGGTMVTLDPINENDYEQLVDGDRAYWIEAISNGDRYVLHVPDTDVTTLRLRYQTKTPTLDSSDTIGTNYPNKKTIALGARQYVKLTQNPDADISQDTSIFERELAKDIAKDRVEHPRKRRRSAHGQAGTSTGDF